MGPKSYNAIELVGGMLRRALAQAGQVEQQTGQTGQVEQQAPGEQQAGQVEQLGQQPADGAVGSELVQATKPHALA